MNESLVLPRERADDTLKKLQGPLASQLRLSVWLAYESHLNSLRFVLERQPRRDITPEQIEELVVIIALAAFNRFVLLQMRGFATFGRTLIRKHNASGLLLGRSTFSGDDFAELTRIVSAFQFRLRRCGIPKDILEYRDVPELVKTYLAMLLRDKR